MLGEHGGDAGLLGVADGYVDGGDGGNGEEGAERVDQDGQALELEKLLGDALVAWAMRVPIPAAGMMTKTDMGM